MPRLSAEFIERPGLRERLDRGAGQDLILVCAPAGYGKSLLLADWAAHRPFNTAWVTVDAEDNDPSRLWTAVMAALVLCPAVTPDREIHRRWREKGCARSVDDLLDALDDLEQPVWLVLDDLHEITAARTLQDIARIVRWRPAMLRPVVAGRIDPPLALPRLRLESRLCEIRADDLRFSGAEAAALLQRSGTELRLEQAEELVTRTEGWVAGIRLAAVALRDSDDRDRFLTEFSGNERSVADYLAEEMMASLDRPSFDFLRAVSVCSPQSDDLAVHLTGQPDAGFVLDRLAYVSGLIELGRSGSYRIHSLLRSYLRADLERRSPGWSHELHGRAAEWWAAREDAVHALRHAERSADDSLLIALLHLFAVGMIARGEHEALRRAIAALSATARATDPTLALLSVLLELRNDTVPHAAALRHARQLVPATPSTRLAVLLESVELILSRYTEQLRGVARAIPEALPPDYRALLHYARSLGELDYPAARDAAERDSAETLRLARAYGYDFLETRGHTVLAVLAWIRGDRAGTERHAREILAAHGSSHPDWTALVGALLAHHALLRRDPACALRQAGAALEAEHLPSPETDFLLHAVHAAARTDEGDPVAGLAEARSARTRLGKAPCLPEFLVTAAVLEHRSALLVGHRGAAADATSWLERRTGRRAEIVLMRALTEQLTGVIESGSATSLAAIADGTAAVLPETRVEALLLRTHIAFDQGSDALGRRLLSVAVAQGRSLGAVRPFAFVAEPIRRELLRLRERQPVADDFLERIAAALAVFRPVVSAPLSARETSVLALLPSLMSAREIGDELGVSQNTVKTHVRSIYKKLGVAQRREAVRKAQERGLLP